MERLALLLFHANDDERAVISKLIKRVFSSGQRALCAAYLVRLMEAKPAKKRRARATEAVRESA